MATKTKPSQNGKKSTKKEKPNSEAAQDLRELFEAQLKDIYWAEKALIKALPKMARQATSEELAAGLTDHLEETREQIVRLEKVFELLGKKAQAKKCEAMEGLLKEGEGIMEETAQGPVRDAGIIAAAQKVEHYEIASYGTLAAFATLLGEEEVAELLQETLEEEKAADMKLTEVAESAINLEAAEEEAVEA